MCLYLSFSYDSNLSSLQGANEKMHYLSDSSCYLVNESGLAFIVFFWMHRFFPCIVGRIAASLGRERSIALTVGDEQFFVLCYIWTTIPNKYAKDAFHWWDLIAVKEYSIPPIFFFAFCSCTVKKIISPSSSLSLSPVCSPIYVHVSEGRDTCSKKRKMHSTTILILGYCLSVAATTTTTTVDVKETKDE